MKASELIDAIERFFLDLVGTIIPGGLFLAGWVLLFGLPRGASAIGANVQLAPYLPWAAVILAYVMGHAVTGIGSILIQPRWCVKPLRRHRWLAWLVKGFKSEKESAETIMEEQIYEAFRGRALQQMPWLAQVNKDQFNEWRSIAMSLLSSQENHTAYRFMFISLLNLGAATVPIVLGIVWLFSGIALFAVWLQPWGSSLFPQRPSIDWSVAIAGAVATWFFLERRLVFFERSLRVPFAMGIVKLVAQEPPTIGGSGTGKPKTVYLAGGTHSNWQDLAIARLRGWNILDPRTHKLQDERAYTLWDLEAIQRSDWILAYFEGTNPGGYNLALEIGYAKALGKKIMYVDERSGVDENVRRYSGMLRATADLTPNSLNDAVNLLAELQH